MNAPAITPKSFQIRATRLKAQLDPSESFYWFYVSIHLEQPGGAEFSSSGLELVEYHLLDSTIPNPNVRITNPRNGFEYCLWLYGFIRASADLITSDGVVLKLPPTELEWSAAEDEIKKNGNTELSW